MMYMKLYVSISIILMGRLCQESEHVDMTVMDFNLINTINL